MKGFHNAVVQVPRGVSPGGWCVTFADLLTLLLCFFIATVGGRPLTPVPPVATEVEAATPAGTPIALIASELSPRSWIFGRAALISDLKELSEPALRTLLGAVNSLGYRNEQLLMTGCSLVGSRGEVVERLTHVRRQLIDAGVSPSALMVRLGRGRCDDERGAQLLKVSLRDVTEKS